MPLLISFQPLVTALSTLQEVTKEASPGTPSATPGQSPRLGPGNTSRALSHCVGGELDASHHVWGGVRVWLTGTTRKHTANFPLALFQGMQGVLLHMSLWWEDGFREALRQCLVPGDPAAAWGYLSPQQGWGPSESTKPASCAGSRARVHPAATAQGDSGGCFGRCTFAFTQADGQGFPAQGLRLRSTHTCSSL